MCVREPLERFCRGEADDEKAGLRKSPRRLTQYAPPTIWNWNQVWSWMEGVESVRRIIEPALILATSDSSGRLHPVEIDSPSGLGQEEGS